MESIKPNGITRADMREVNMDKGSEALARKAILAGGVVALAGSAVGVLGILNGTIAGAQTVVIPCGGIFGAGILLTLLFYRRIAVQTVASASTVFYNVALGIVMWVGRFWPIVAALAIAGSLAAKKRIPVTEGTMPTHGPLFITLLIGTILLIGVLNYVPALALGPIVEHFMLTAAH